MSRHSIRHQSQIKAIDDLLMIRDAIHKLEWDTRITWCGHTCSIVLDDDVFRRMFRGFDVQEHFDGSLRILWDGVYYSTHPRTKQETTTVTL